VHHYQKRILPGFEISSVTRTNTQTASLIKDSTLRGVRKCDRSNVGLGHNPTRWQLTHRNAIVASFTRAEWNADFVTTARHTEKPKNVT
jgi:hypothetical protein